MLWLLAAAAQPGIFAGANRAWRDFKHDNHNDEGTNTIVFNPAGKNKLAGFIVFSEQAYPKTLRLQRDVSAR